MTGRQCKLGQLALVKAVRGLDQGGSETVYDKLDEIWTILEMYKGSELHAAEEMLVRWLLKNMNGSSADSQKLRRHALTWRILGKLFTSVPSFSLAKSLADRRFVQILQSTLKDLSEPEENIEQRQTPDTEMADADVDEARPRKKRRSEAGLLDKGNDTRGCIRTATCLFTTVALLLARLEHTPWDNAQRDNRMGVEHIRSLFCCSASDIRDLILAALKVCKLSVDENALWSLEDWISSASSLWNLHLQGDGDALMVASYFAPPVISMLAKLSELRRQGVSGTTDITSALTQFMVRNLVLPARAAFLNMGSLEIVRQTIQSTIGTSTVSCPIILDLILAAPSLAGSQSAKRETDSWIQEVFSLLDDTLQSSKSERKYGAIRDMMFALKLKNGSLPTPSLLSVCETYALRDRETDWRTLCAVARINPDVFTTGPDHVFLHAVLARMGVKATDSIRDDSHPDDASAQAEVVQIIADSFAKARDLPTFMKIWFSHLAAANPHMAHVSDSGSYQIWHGRNVCSVVTDALEKTTNIKQILSLLDWLDSQAGKAADNAAVVLLADVLSQGITHDDVADAVGMRLFDITIKRAMLLSGETNDEVIAAQWTVARRCLQWATLEQARIIWESLVSHLRCTLAEPKLTDAHVFEAFKFASTAWEANYPGGQYENDAADLTLGALSHLYELPHAHPERSGNDHPVIEFLVGDASCQRSNSVYGLPRLLSMIIERGGDHVGKVMEAALAHHIVDRFAVAAHQQFRCLKAILANENNTNSRRTMDMLLKLLSDEIRKSSNSEEVARAVEGLLAFPEQTITRERREELMALLVSVMARYSKADGPPLKYVTPIVSLMTRLMRRPTFYPDMAFADIDDAVLALLPHSDDAWKGSQNYLPLIEELAACTMKQMTANVGPREEQYFRVAISTMEHRVRSNIGEADNLTVFRIVLLKVLILAVKESLPLEKDDSLSTRELEHHFIKMTESAVEQFCSTWDTQSDMSAISAVLDAVVDLYHNTAAVKLAGELKKALIPYSQRLREFTKDLRPGTTGDFWSLRRYLAVTRDEVQESLSGSDKLANLSIGLSFDTSSEVSGHIEGLLKYIDTVVADADDTGLLGYIRTLLQPPETSNKPAELIAIHRIVQRLSNKPTSANLGVTGENDPTFDLARLQTVLSKRLRLTDSRGEFMLSVQILETLFDDKPASMTQWNIELMLSTVSYLASKVTTHKVMSTTSKAFELLCRLVRVILRRHRLRLEGHFHLLVTALQSLLRAFLCHPFDSRNNEIWAGGLIRDGSKFGCWQGNAKVFGRLLTMVCEPTHGSVARSQHSSLDSATDGAKRYAGQHMYLVLMLFIKLQLEQNVAHDVREALEPGMFAILDITTPEGRRIMNDALDPSGRAMMKELYKQYLKFGKWSGI